MLEKRHIDYFSFRCINMSDEEIVQRINDEIDIRQIISDDIILISESVPTMVRVFYKRK